MKTAKAIRDIIAKENGGVRFPQVPCWWAYGDATPGLAPFPKKWGAVGIIPADLKTWLAQNAGVMIAERKEALVAQLQIEVLQCADECYKRRKNHLAKRKNMEKSPEITQSL